MASEGGKGRGEFAEEHEMQEVKNEVKGGQDNLTVLQKHVEFFDR